jgi:hypothetical protein
MNLTITARRSSGKRYSFVQVRKMRADARGTPVPEVMLELRVHNYQLRSEEDGSVSLTPQTRQSVQVLAAALAHNPDLKIQMEPEE